MISYSFLCKARLAIYTIKGHRVLMRGTEGWVRGSMGLPSQLYAVKMQEWGVGVGQNPGCAAVASVSWALQLASSSRQQQGLWMRRDLSQEERTGLCCSEPRAVVRPFPLELPERAYCKRTSLEIEHHGQ